LAGNDVVPESEPGGVHNDSSWKGGGVLLPLVPSLAGYPQMRFALTNGASAWVKDLGQANPTWQVMGTRPAEIGGSERHYANATLLPTGQIFVSGGVGPSEHDHDA